MEKFREKIFKYRYVMAAVIFAACIFVGINFSSVGCLVEQFGHEDTDVILGISRQIRSDEFGTFTPMTFAQYMDPQGKFQYFSSVIRGDKTDVFITYGQPVLSLLMVFRPFQLGYLFLNVEHGMAFFWCGRLIVLLMVSFEFARLLTEDDRRLSVIYALMLALAPAVQWWFAVNGFVEMLIAAQLSIVLLNRYLDLNKGISDRTDEEDISFGRIVLYKFIYAAGIMLSAGMFVFTLYPAWMVPMAYLIIALIIWQLYSYKTTRTNKIATDICIVIIMTAILGISVYTVYTKSHDAINAIMNTAYPGKRFETGGGALKHLFNYASEIWYAHRGASPYYNVCESAYFIDLFPLGHLLYIVYMLKNKKTDALTNVLFAVSLILFIYIVIGVPEIIAKLTGLGYSTANRALVVFSLISMMILFRTVHVMRKENVTEEEKVEKKASRQIIYLAAAFILAALSILITRSINPGYWSIKLLIGSFVVISLLVYSFIVYSADNGNTVLTKAVLCIIFFMVFFTGILVNPVRLGVRSVENLPELDKAYEISLSDRSALWIVEGAKYPVTNALLLKGIRTVNSTNVYPDLDRWKLIDDSYDKIYNRYAHIEVEYVDDSSDDMGLSKEGSNSNNNMIDQKFELIDQDCFRVYLTYKDLKTLDVGYIFSSSVIEDERLELLVDMGDYRIYQCK